MLAQRPGCRRRKTVTVEPVAGGTGSRVGPTGALACFLQAPAGSLDRMNVMGCGLPAALTCTTTEGAFNMLKTCLTASLVSIGALGLVGCDVNKTQEGSVQAPKYDVSKTQEGNVTVPKYDVTPPDVKVGQKEATVKVPDVDVNVKSEEKKVTVPSVKVTPAPDK